MAGLNDKLTRKQADAVGAIVSNSSIAAAARSCGVAERTLYRWLEIPAFSTACDEAQRRILSSTVTNLQRVSLAAVAVLASIMADKAATDGARIAASRTILEYSFRSKEHEIEDRLAALESTLAEQKLKGEQYDRT